MNFDPIILTLIIATPLAGAILLALVPEKQGSKTHAIGALLITLFTLLLTLHLPNHFNYHAAPRTFQFEQNLSWIPSPNIRYHLGVDGLSMWLIVLAAFLAPIGVLASWNVIHSRTKLFYTLFLLQQVAMLGIFAALDLFLYAFIPSAILLVAILWLYNLTGTFDLPTLQYLALTHHLAATPTALLLCSIAFLVAFAVKVPVFPLHGWLQDAVAEAPTAAVMVLAGKLGLYSILRFSFGIFPDQSRHVAPVLIALGAIGIVYGSLIALIKTDLKKLAAFSTLAHVSFVILGIFTFTVIGLDGGVFQILNESLIGAALFILLGLLYERYGTYDMRDYGGLATRHPWMVTLFVITVLAAAGLPMLNGFVGEFLILSGSMQSIATHHILWTTLAATGVIFGASYLLWMIQRVFYGSLGVRPDEVPGWDLTAREHLELWPFAALFLAMGIASPFWMRAIDTYGGTTAGQLVEVGHGFYKNAATGEYSINNQEYNRWCLDHPGHCRVEVRAVLLSAQQARDLNAKEAR